MVLIIVALSACGKPPKMVTVNAIIPGHSTTENVYNGPCASTYNDDFTQYEIQWSNGESACYSREAVDGKIKVGDVLATADYS